MFRIHTLYTVKLHNYTDNTLLQMCGTQVESDHKAAGAFLNSRVILFLHCTDEAGMLASIISK